jgi:hypothetical protein
MRIDALIIVVASGLLLATSSVFAESAPADTNAPTATSTPPATTPPNSDDVVTCHYEKTTGSNFSTKVCHTQREWQQMGTGARDFMNRHDRGTQGTPGGG